MIAGGVESMTRAPFVMGKADSAFSRNSTIYDTTIGWRFPNPLMEQLYGTDSMPETAENVADDYKVSRADQDAFALASQAKAARAQQRRAFRAGDRAGPDPAEERRGDPLRPGRASARDHHRSAGETEGRGACGRHGHRRQRLGRQRRRLRAAAGQCAKRRASTA
jgi:acetyl-CoA acyltransferase